MHKSLGVADGKPMVERALMSFRKPLLIERSVEYAFRFVFLRLFITLQFIISGNIQLHSTLLYMTTIAKETVEGRDIIWRVLVNNFPYFLNVFQSNHMFNEMIKNVIARCTSVQQMSAVKDFLNECQFHCRAVDQGK